jgi:cell wall assembly regulator SMI1
MSSLERALGMPVPVDLRTFYSVADGDGPAIEDEPDSHGLLLGAVQGPRWIRGMRWLSAQEVSAALWTCRDAMPDAFGPAWIPIASDDNGNFVVVDAQGGGVFVVDHESPEKRPENVLASAIADLLEDLVRGLDSGAIRCDAAGLFRVVAPVVTPPDTAVGLASLLIERGLVVPVQGCGVDDCAAAVRTVLAGRGRAKTKAKKLLRLLEEAPWVDEIFATEELLEIFVDEFQ